MFKKPQNLKGLTVNLVLGHFKQCSRVEIFLLFVELILMDSFHILWNKFQDYQLRFILTNHFSRGGRLSIGNTKYFSFHLPFFPCKQKQST